MRAIDDIGHLLVRPRDENVVVAIEVAPVVNASPDEFILPVQVVVDVGTRVGLDVKRSRVGGDGGDDKGEDESQSKISVTL